MSVFLTGLSILFAIAAHLWFGICFHGIVTIGATVWELLSLALRFVLLWAGSLVSWHYARKWGARKKDKNI